MSTGYDVWFTEDAQEFLDRAGRHLAQDPATGTVVATTAQRLVDHGPGDLPHHWFAVVTDENDAIAGIAMRTMPMAPYSPYALAMPDAAARAIATALIERGESIDGINGARPSADLIAATMAAADGRAVAVSMHMRLFELGTLVAPRAVEGRLRAVGPGEAEAALAWIHQFFRDADEQGGREPGSAHNPAEFTLRDVRRKIDEGVLWFWVDAGDRPVHLTGANPPAFGVSRVGPVFTPKGQRGKGWAGAAVAEVSRTLAEQGNRVILFTDQANPTSNALYVALGYEPVVDMVNLEFI